MKTALVTAIGSFSADVVITNLHEAGVRVVGCDIYPEQWLATSLEVDAFYHAPLARDAQSYMSFICETVRHEKADYVIPLTDIEVDVLSAHRAMLEDCGATLCVSPAKTIETCRDKKSFHDFVAALDMPLNVIPTQLLAEIDEPAQYPIVAKPANGRSSEGLCIVHDASDWQWLERRASEERYIVQPFIEGRIVTVDVVRDPRAGAAVAIPREELLRTPNGAGTSVRVFNDESLVATCRKLADALGICGCVNFEFIHAHDGSYWLVECNPRFSGGVKFSCMMGYDFVENHLRCFEGHAIDALVPYDACFIARKYEEIVTRGA